MRKIALVILLSLIPLLSQGAPAFEKKWNIQFSPILVLVGGVQGNLDYKLNDQFVIGPYFEYLNVKIFDVKLKASAIGLNAKYHFESVFKDGWYVKAILASTSAKAEANDVNGNEQTASASGTYYAGGGGYHWFWQSFNLNLGAMLGGFSYDKIVVKDSSGAEVESYTPAHVGFDFLIGFTF